MLRAATVSFLVGLFLGLFVTSAVAYPRHASGCPFEPNLGYNFSGGGWNANRIGWFASGAAVWDEVLDREGDPITDTSPTGVIEIEIDNGLAYYGLTSCTDNPWPLPDLLEKIELNPVLIAQDLVGEAESFEGISAHEAGHAHGLKHVGGTSETHDGYQYPTMAKSSCIFSAPNGVNFLADLQQDDNAQLQRHYQSSFHANPSFEQEDLYWGTGGGGVLTTPVMSNAKRGSRVGRLEGSYGAYAYQTITLRTKEATVAGGNPGKVDMRLFHKSGSSPATGHVSVAIHSKLFDVGAASDPCNPGVTAWNYESGGTWSESNGWAYAVTAPDWDAGAEWGDGVVIRIYVYNYLELDGSPWPVQLDDVRARPQ